MNLEKRIFDFALWLIAAVILLGIMAGCNPYEVQSTTTATAEPNQTAAASVTPPKIATPTPETCTVRTNVPDGKLNLRTGPGTNYSVIRVLAEGEVVTVIERGAWLEVSTRNRTGFIHSHYCEIGD